MGLQIRVRAEDDAESLRIDPAGDDSRVPAGQDAGGDAEFGIAGHDLQFSAGQLLFPLFHVSANLHLRHVRQVGVGEQRLCVRQLREVLQRVDVPLPLGNLGRFVGLGGGTLGLGRTHGVLVRLGRAVGWLRQIVHRRAAVRRGSCRRCVFEAVETLGTVVFVLQRVEDLPQLHPVRFLASPACADGR